MAATAAHRLGVTPVVAHLARTSCPVAGRYNRPEAPAARVMHLTRGYRRAPRPGRQRVMLDLLVAHRAGMPLLRHPLSGTPSDAPDFRPVVPAPLAQLHTTYGTASLVADSALSHAAHLQQLTQTQRGWITRVPAPVSAAQAARADADPAPLLPVRAGDRAQGRPSTYGGGAQRWGLLSPEPRRPQAQRTAETPRLTQRTAESHALQQRRRTGLACQAAAQQALAPLARGWPAPSLHEVTLRPTQRSAKPGRPGKATGPDAQGYPLAGALASSLTARDALVAPHRGVMLATNARDAGA
jgi:hypothetical protein